MNKQCPVASYYIKCSVLLTFYFIIQSASAQHARFVNQGLIEYEKRVNMFAKISKMINKDNESFLKQAYEQYRKTQPQFKTVKNTLSFNHNITLFQPVDDEVPSTGFFSDPSVTTTNIVYTDLDAQSSTSRKKIYEETYLVTDSIRQIAWKITDEKREIAGYDCRRANAIIMDSIYVVAFYTDQIPSTGGPESFSGLPGMILGVALPHENTTWFATKVQDTPVSMERLSPPKKGKNINNQQLFDILQSSLKSWGIYAQSALKAFML